MRRLAIGCVTLLAACESGGFGASGNGRQELMVIGGRMSFEECRARGGYIIRDANTPMIACDPTVRREPVPADEFNNPSNAG